MGNLEVDEKSIRPGRPAAAAAIWNWRQDTVPDSAHPSHRRPMLLRSVVAYGIGLLVLRFWSSTVGGVVLGFATLMLLAALLSPRLAGAAIDRIFRATGLVARRILTWVLLVPILYLIIFPFGLLFRRGRRDRLKRYLEPEAKSYWEPLEGPTAPSTVLERQY